LAPVVYHPLPSLTTSSDQVCFHCPSDDLFSQFSQQVWQHGNTGKRAPRPFTYENWSQAL